MADAVSLSPGPHKRIPSGRKNGPSKLDCHFLCKSALVTAFLIFLPLFPSIAPDFINQTVHAGIWEPLQLICVGIAVSYGLFSQKNDQPKKDLDGGSKPENTHSFVRKLLQVSSVFDDEPESPETVVHQESKVETLNSQYFRGEPIVMVAKQIPNPIVKKDKGVCQISQNKPLLLPVRSLKQRVPESAEVGSGCRVGPIIGPPNDNLSRINGDPRNVGDNVSVLCSPIPWRSRSVKMTKDENGDMKSNVSDDEKLFKSPLNPDLATHKKLNQSTSLPSKSPAAIRRNKNEEPAPPLPQFLHKSLNFSKNNVATDLRQMEKDGKTHNPNDVVKFVEFAEKKGLVVTGDDDEISNNGDVGPDVDKKADEFIAKFREQIRLQRIESSRRS